jgi:serine/threonine protein phosphatase PrpC
LGLPQHLVNMANEAGGKDNITLVLVSLVESDSSSKNTSSHAASARLPVSNSSKAMTTANRGL